MNNTEKLVELIKENPDLPVLPMVWYEVVSDDSCGYWLGSFENCFVGEYACYNERWYEDRDSLEEDYHDRHYDEYEGMTDEEIDVDIKAKTESMWKKAIILWIGLPD